MTAMAPGQRAGLLSAKLRALVRSRWPGSAGQPADYLNADWIGLDR